MNLIAVISMGILGAIFALGLAFAHKTLKPDEDPRVEEVEDLLPGADCGACGYSGCAAMAKAVVGEKASPADCPVADEETVEKIAETMGISLDSGGDNEVARVLCRGGDEEAVSRGEYSGIETCEAADLIGGGAKACTYGCLGYGDCVDVCDFAALEINENGLPVVQDENCTGCGACVEACPRDLIELHPPDRQLFVWCKSHADTQAAREVCDVACIGCSLCANLCDDVEMENNLAVVDHEATDSCDPGTEKCPTGAIAYRNSNSS